jgi:hypothetical protein
VGLWLADGSRQRSLTDLVKGVLRGYPFTAALGGMIVVLAAVALVRKVSSLRRRWEDAHIPVIVKPGGYDRVVAELADVLAGAGLDVEVREAPRAISLPPRLLDRVAGSALGGMVPDHLARLAGEDLDILIYPSDVAITGERAAVARARAAVASRLTRAPAWLTMSAEAQAIEDDIEAIRRSAELQTTPKDAFRDIDEALATIVVPFDDWETLYRMRLQVERTAQTDTLRPARLAAPVVEPASPSARRPELAAALAVMALLALDIIAILAQRAGLTNGPPLRRSPG